MFYRVRFLGVWVGYRGVIYELMILFKFYFEIINKYIYECVLN